MSRSGTPPDTNGRFEGGAVLLRAGSEIDLAETHRIRLGVDGVEDPLLGDGKVMRAVERDRACIRHRIGGKPGQRKSAEADTTWKDDDTGNAAIRSRCSRRTCPHSSSCSPGDFSVQRLSSFIVFGTTCLALALPAAAQGVADTIYSGGPIVYRRK